MCKEIEYQKSQDSAEHHDNLVWTMTSILWTGNLVLLGFTVNNLTDPKLKTILIFLSSLGIFLVICMYIFALLFNSITKQKYTRCIELEKELGFEQHTKLKYPRGTQKIILSLITMAFVLIWISVITTISSITTSSSRPNSAAKAAPLSG